VSGKNQIFSNDLIFNNNFKQGQGFFITSQPYLIFVHFHQIESFKINTFSMSNNKIEKNSKLYIKLETVHKA